MFSMVHVKGAYSISMVATWGLGFMRVWGLHGFGAMGSWVDGLRVGV